MRYNVRIEDEKVVGAANHSALTFADAINAAMNGMAVGDMVTISPVRETETATARKRAKIDITQAIADEKIQQDS